MERLRFPIFLFAYLILVRCAPKDWNDAYGRKAFNILFYSIGQTPQACLTKYYPGYEVQTTLKTSGDLIYKSGYVSISVNIAEQVIQVSFRGSETYNDLFLNSAPALLSRSDLKPTDLGGQLAEGHLVTFGNLWSGGLESAMQDVWEKYCDFKLRIVGHSMGGCLAQVLSIRMWKDGMWPTELIELFSFGNSRCGDMDFALTVNKSAKMKFRINNQNDIVPGNPGIGGCSSSSKPTYPMNNNCFWHCCDTLKYKNSTNLFGSITGSEILYCDNPEDTTCGGALLDLNMGNNFQFMGRTNTGEYGTIKC